MAFPASEKDLEVCVAYGANLASSLPGLTYSANLAPTLVRPRLTIARGRIAGATRTQPTSIAFELMNPNGIFSPRNISGPNYGRLRRNTPVRVRLDAGSGLVTRGIAYMPDWPTRWTGPNIDDRIPMQASGAMRRLGTGQDSKSALRRSVLASNPAAYWPLEDKSGSTSAGSALSGGAAMSASGTVAFGTTLYPVGSAGGVDLSGNGRLTAPTGLAAGAATSWEIEACIGWSTLPTISASTVGLSLITCSTPGGSFTKMGIGLGYTAPNVQPFHFSAYVDDGLGFQSSSNQAPDIVAGRTYHVRVRFDQIGADIQQYVWVDGVGGLLIGGLFAGKTLAKPTDVTINPGDGFNNTSQPHSVSHAGIWTPVRGSATTYQAAPGYAGELAAARVSRLCTEEGVTVDVTAGPSEPMGPQPSGTVVDLLRECEDADEGTLIERRTGELGFDPRSSRYNKAVTMTVNYVTQVADLLPDDDDRDLVNYATVTRIGGSSATYERTDGPLGTDRAAGVDRYPNPYNRSLATDSQPIQHASYIVYRGTVDEPRYVIVINLVAHPELIPQWLACDIGSRILATNPPAIQVGPAPLDLVIEGYTELLDGVEWLVTIYATPYRINEVLQVETGTGNRSRIASGVSTTDLAYSATAASLSVTSASVRWIDSATYPSMFPILVEVAGEVMTCTSIVGTGLTQTFAVTRGLHGISKPLPISSAVQAWRAPAIAL